MKCKQPRLGFELIEFIFYDDDHNAMIASKYVINGYAFELIE